VAARSKARFYGRSLAGIAGSNPAWCMNVCLLWVLCVVRQRSLRRADHSSRGVLPSVVCLSVIEEPHRESLGLLWLSSHETCKAVSYPIYVRKRISYSIYGHVSSTWNALFINWRQIRNSSNTVSKSFYFSDLRKFVSRIGTVPSNQMWWTVQVLDK
jgi:hypothetical protein